MFPVMLLKQTDVKKTDKKTEKIKKTEIRPKNLKDWRLHMQHGEKPLR